MKNQNQSRRNFLKLFGAAVVAAPLVVALPQTASAATFKPATPETWTKLTEQLIECYYEFIASTAKEREIYLETFLEGAGRVKSQNAKNLMIDVHAAFLAKHIELKEGEK